MKRFSRLNAELQRIFASGLRTHLNAADLPEWIQLAPYGEWPTSERNDDGQPEAVQIFTRDDAAALVKRFNAWHRRLSRLARLNSCKVYVGHPDFAPEIWPQRIDLGDVVELSEDENGLNGRIRWNADAATHLKKHAFPSVAWDTDEEQPGREHPVMLWSVGMWHRPNIKGVRSAINALPDVPDPTQNDNMNLIEQIKALLIKAGLLKETDSEESLLGGISSLIQNIVWKRESEERDAKLASEIKTALNSESDLPVVEGVTQIVARLNADASELGTLRERVNALTAERDAERTARINAILDRLVETGRVSKADADAEGDDSLRARLNADPDKAVAELLQEPARLNSTPVKITNRTAPEDAFERSARLNAWVDAHMAKNQCDYHAAWEASKADPEMKAIHQAMEDADKARTA